MELIEKIKAFFEEKAFGVCAFWADFWGMTASSVRLFFIYLSFLTFGSPIIIYLILYFVMNIHKHFRRKRSAIWDI
jgi:phage shock protein C